MGIGVRGRGGGGGGGGASVQLLFHFARVLQIRAKLEAKWKRSWAEALICTVQQEEIR